MRAPDDEKPEDWIAISPGASAVIQEAVDLKSSFAWEDSKQYKISYRGSNEVVWPTGQQAKRPKSALKNSNTARKVPKSGGGEGDGGVGDGRDEVVAAGRAGPASAASVSGAFGAAAAATLRLGTVLSEAGRFENRTFPGPNCRISSMKSDCRLAKTKYTQFLKPLHVGG